MKHGAASTEPSVVSRWRTVSALALVVCVGCPAASPSSPATTGPDAGRPEPASEDGGGSGEIDAGTAALGPVDAAVDTGTPMGTVDSEAPPVLSAKTLAALRELSPDELPPPPLDVSNRYGDNAAAAALGHQFFFDPKFSGQLLDEDNNGDRTSLGRFKESGKVACAGCHIPTDGFLDTRSVRQTVSLASAWGKRRTPSLFDVGQAKIVMWDGRHDALFNQPFGALEAGIEMNSSRLYGAQQIYARYRKAYEAVFGPIPIPLDDATRFPQLDGDTTGCRKLAVTPSGIFSTSDCHGVPGDGAEFDGLTSDDQEQVTRVWTNVGKSIAAYERLLTCGQSRFDQWMHGDAQALTPAEQRGAALFVGTRENGDSFTGCNTCHSGPYLSDQAFHNVGLQAAGVGPAASFVDTADKGAFSGLTDALTDPLNVRGKFSDGDDGRLPEVVMPQLDGAFRTPGLRCVALRPSLMHTGQLRSSLALSKAVDFFNQGGSSGGYEGTNELSPLNLTEREKDDLVAFMRALTGPGPGADLMAVPDLP